MLLLLALVGCGRLGFDEAEPSPPAPDAAAAVPNLCNRRTIGSIALGTESAVKLRATTLSNGHAVAVQTDGNNTYVARLDAAGDVESTHLPFGGNGYQLFGISEVSDRPFVYVFTAGGGYIKLLTPDWNAYDTGPSGEERPMDPQQALLPGGSAAVFGTMSGGVLSIGSIDATNTVLGAADYSPVAGFASFGSIASGVRVVISEAGACETFAIAADGTTGPRHQFSPCFEPRLATLGNEGVVLHRTSDTGSLALHQIPADASQVGSTTVLEDGSNPRIAAIDGAIWVGYLRDAGGARLIRVVEEVVTMRDDPSIDVAFDLLADGAFWVTATGELHAGTPCL